MTRQQFNDKVEKCKVIGSRAYSAGMIREPLEDEKLAQAIKGASATDRQSLQKQWLIGWDAAARRNKK